MRKIVLGALALVLVLASPVISTAASLDADSRPAWVTELNAKPVSDERASKIRGELAFTYLGYSSSWSAGADTSTHHVVGFKADQNVNPNDLAVYKYGEMMRSWFGYGSPYTVVKYGNTYYAMIQTRYVTFHPNTWMNGVTIGLK